MDTNAVKKLKALIQLLDEPDPDIFDEIKMVIFTFGTEAIDILEHEWETSADETIQLRIENIIHTIQFNKIKAELTDWKRSSDKNLLAAFLIISNYQYPELDKTLIMSKIREIKETIWLELNDNLTALEKTKVMNHVLFDMCQFHGTANSNNNLPQHFLNNLLENKTGSPFAIGLLYLTLSRELELPVYGVLIPNNLILAWSNHFLNSSLLYDDAVDEILFYINPFKQGTIFTRNEIDLYLRQIKTKPEPSYYTPSPFEAIIWEFLNQLSLLYGREAQARKVSEIKQLMRILMPE